MTYKEGFIFHLFDDVNSAEAIIKGYYDNDNSSSDIEKKFPSFFYLYEKVINQLYNKNFDGKIFYNSEDEWIGIQIFPIHEEELIEFVLYAEIEFDETDEDGDHKIEPGQIQVILTKNFELKINWSSSSENGSIDIEDL